MIIGPPKERDPLVSNELVLALDVVDVPKPRLRDRGTENNPHRYHCVVQHGATFDSGQVPNIGGR